MNGEQGPSTLVELCSNTMGVSPSLNKIISQETGRLIQSEMPETQRVRIPLSLVAVVRDKQKEIRSRPKSKRKMTAEDKEDILRAKTQGARGSSMSEEEEHQLYYVEQMGFWFAEKFAIYHHKKRYASWRDLLYKRPGVGACLSRSVAQCELLGVTCEEYMEAQFFMFHQMFGRAPKVYECCTPNAISRVLEWLRKREQGTVSTKTVAKSVYTKDPTQISQDEQMEYELKVLQKMIRHWGSEEAVWEMCGEADNEEVFSNAFKRTRLIWKQRFG